MSLLSSHWGSPFNPILGCVVFKTDHAVQSPAVVEQFL